MRRQAESFLGSGRGGPFWDRWLREYYMVRIPVWVHVERMTVWPDLRCDGPAGALRAAGAEHDARSPAGAAPRARRRAWTWRERPSGSPRRPTCCWATSPPTATRRWARSSWPPRNATGLELTACARRDPRGRAPSRLARATTTGRSWSASRRASTRAGWRPARTAPSTRPTPRPASWRRRTRRCCCSATGCRRSWACARRAARASCRRQRGSARASAAHARQGSCGRSRAPPRWRCTSSPLPIPSAARPAAISARPGPQPPVLALDLGPEHRPPRARPRASGVEASSCTAIGSAKATCTRRGFGNGPEEELLGAGDRRRHQRRAGLERQPAGAALGVAQLVRVADARALGEERQQAALARGSSRAVSSASASDAPRRTGKAPRRTSRRP